MLAMRRAVEGLRLQARHGAGGWQPAAGAEVPAEAIVKGDAKVPAISAASILAKVHRDRWCLPGAPQYPNTALTAQGLPTAAHLAALREHGACPAHRRSFAPVAQAALATGVRAAPAQD
jgi:ribonuclease HII